MNKNWLKFISVATLLLLASRVFATCEQECAVAHPLSESNLCSTEMLDSYIRLQRIRLEFGSDFESVNVPARNFERKAYEKVLKEISESRPEVTMIGGVYPLAFAKCFSSAVGWYPTDSAVSAGKSKKSASTTSSKREESIKNKSSEPRIIDYSDASSTYKIPKENKAIRYFPADNKCLQPVAEDGRTGYRNSCDQTIIFGYCNYYPASENDRTVCRPQDSEFSRSSYNYVAQSGGLEPGETTYQPYRQDRFQYTWVVACRSGRNPLIESFDTGALSIFSKAQTSCWDFKDTQATHNQ
jgi:hypothetical protein